MQPTYLCPMTVPPPPQLLTPNLFLSHIRDRGSSLGSGHIPGLEPSPRTAHQNMLTICCQIRCKGELVKLLKSLLKRKEKETYISETYISTFLCQSLLSTYLDIPEISFERWDYLQDNFLRRFRSKVSISFAFKLLLT